MGQTTPSILARRYHKQGEADDAVTTVQAILTSTNESVSIFTNRTGTESLLIVVGNMTERTQIALAKALQQGEDIQLSTGLSARFLRAHQSRLKREARKEVSSYAATFR